VFVGAGRCRYLLGRSFAESCSGRDLWCWSGRALQVFVWAGLCSSEQTPHRSPSRGAQRLARCAPPHAASRAGTPGCSSSSPQSSALRGVARAGLCGIVGARLRGRCLGGALLVGANYASLIIPSALCAPGILRTASLLLLSHPKPAASGGVFGRGFVVAVWAGLCRCLLGRCCLGEALRKIAQVGLRGCFWAGLRRIIREGLCRT
jgi:hypothetical protein